MLPSGAHQSLSVWQFWCGGPRANEHEALVYLLESSAKDLPQQRLDPPVCLVFSRLSGRMFAAASGLVGGILMLWHLYAPIFLLHIDDEDLYPYTMCIYVYITSI